MYQITITKQVSVKKLERGEYVKVGQIKSDEGFINGVKDKYEYGPDREYETLENREVYKQQVDDLDMVAVINAVNGGRKCSDQA